MFDYDVLIIGAGPAGNKCARDLAQAGKKVGLIEKDAVGGTCLNRGCIPLKAYLYSVELFDSAKKAKRHGVEISEVNFNWTEAKANKDRSVKMLSMGLNKSLNDAGVEIISGLGNLVGKNEVQVVFKDDAKTLSAEQIVLAVGTHSLFVPSIVKGENVITSTDLLNLEKVPESLFIIGGGVTGVEAATVFSTLGTKVTMVERQDHILSWQDKEITDVLHSSLQKRGCEIFVSSEVLSCADKDGGAEVRFKKADGSEEVRMVDKALVSIGRRPNYDLAQLEAVGIKNDGKKVVVNKFLQTSLEHIYLVGDAAFNNLTAYGAEKEGEVAAAHILGENKTINYALMPITVFSHPEVAHVGQTEEQLKKQGVKYVIKKDTYAANAKALILGEREGMVRIMIEKESQKILGVSIVGARSTEMIHQALLPIKLGLTVEEWLEVVWSHPVLAELVKTCLESEDIEA